MTTFCLPSRTIWCVAQGDEMVQAWSFQSFSICWLATYFPSPFPGCENWGAHHSPNTILEDDRETEVEARIASRTQLSKDFKIINLDPQFCKWSYLPGHGYSTACWNAYLPAGFEVGRRGWAWLRMKPVQYPNAVSQPMARDHNWRSWFTVKRTPFPSGCRYRPMESSSSMPTWRPPISPRLEPFPSDDLTSFTIQANDFLRTDSCDILQSWLGSHEQSTFGYLWPCSIPRRSRFLTTHPRHLKDLPIDRVSIDAWLCK